MIVAGGSRMARKAKTKRAAKSARPKAEKPAADPLDAYIAAAAQALDLPLTPQYQPGVKANLAVTLRMGSFVGAFPLPDEAEPAPVFRA